MYNLYCETLKKVTDSELRISTAKNGHNLYKLSDRLNTVKGKIEQFN